jgi:hypothetical protein
VSKLKHWSEEHNRTTDSMHGLGSADMAEEKVGETITSRGVLWLCDCTHCGRQWKGVVTWPEVANFYLMQPIPTAHYTKQGIVTLNGCNGCQQNFRVVVDYDEVRRWVDSGVRNRYLTPQIHEAAEALRQQAANARK